jgi:hypothetical protein
LFLALFSAFVGGLIGFLGGLYTQNLQFKKQEENNLKIAKSQLALLKEELFIIYESFFIGDNQLYCSQPHRFFLNFREFDSSNKDAMWLNLINTNLIITNRELFTQINFIYTNLKLLNEDVRVTKTIEHDIQNPDNINFRRIIDRLDQIRRNYDSLARHENNLNFQQTRLCKSLDKIII